MRIVGGKWAGRHLVSPATRVRPTAENARVRWMEIVAPYLADARMLDLFAGCGAVGLEALSRGGKRLDLVENGTGSLHALKANVAALHAKPRARVFKRDAIPFVESLEAKVYDLAFADPPYGSQKLDRVLARWREVPFATVFSFEHDRDHSLAVKGKKYDLGGDTVLTVLVAR